jgi:hypothetical protein
MRKLSVAEQRYAAVLAVIADGLSGAIGMPELEMHCSAKELAI